MLAKYSILLTCVALIIAFSTQAQAQQTRFDRQVVGVGLFQDEEPASELTEQFERLELRLRELEDDVEEKLKSAGGDDGDADLEEFEERIAKLETGYEYQQESINDLDGTLPGLIYHSHNGPKMNFFGRIHYDYWSFPDVDDTVFPLEGGNPQDRFQFRRLRLGVKGDLNDNIGYKLEAEFAGGGSSYRDAYITFKHRPRFNTVIVGNHKRPYGLDHLNSSRYNLFLERPLIVEAFNQDSRRLGISSIGYTEDQRVNWRYGLWNQVLTQNIGQYVGDHYQPELAGRVAFTPWYDDCSGGRGYAHFAVSGSVGNPDGGGANNAARYRTRPEARTTNQWLDTGTIAGADHNSLIGLESVINVGAFQFTGEYMRANVDRDAAFGNGAEFDGGYVQIGYFLTGEHTPWDRKRGTLGRVRPFENFFTVRDCDCNVRRGLGAIQVVSRYSWADLTDENIVGGEVRSLTNGFNWWFNPYSRLQFNHIIGDIDRGAAGFGDYQVFGMRLMVDF